MDTPTASNSRPTAPKNGNNTHAPWSQSDAKPIVEFRNLTKHFGDFTAVNDVNLKIYPGEFFALLGPSGCGKSTLLRMLAGFETPSEGMVLLDGADIAHTPPNKRPINMMFQSYALFPHLSVRDNIAFGLKRGGSGGGMGKSEIEDRTQEMLRLVKMESFANRKPHQMSGGQRQRVALARSLAKNPKLLLLDEPLGALDAKLREATQFELVNIQEKLGTTFIIVTHDQEEAMTVATRIGVMNMGVLAQVDTPGDIYENPKSKFVADFIGDVNLLDVIVGESAENRGEYYEIFRIDGVEGVFSAREKVADRRSGELASGMKASFAIRPEKISVSKEKPKDAANQLRGTVEDIAYVGNLSTYYVRLASGQLIKAQEVNRRQISNREITWEDQVWLGWSRQGGLLLSE